MSLVIFRLSGYSCSSIVLLYSVVSVGAKKDARSLMIAGLMLYISLALFGFILFSVFRTFFTVVCLSMNGGRLFFCWGRGVISLCGMDSDVFPPMVM